MGRTVPTYNTYLQHEESTWSSFRRSLRSADEKEAFDHLFTHARTYAAECTAAAREVPFEAILISMLLGQEMELRRLREKLEKANSGSERRAE